MQKRGRVKVEVILRTQGDDPVVVDDYARDLVRAWKETSVWGDAIVRVARIRYKGRFV